MIIMEDSIMIMPGFAHSKGTQINKNVSQEYSTHTTKSLEIFTTNNKPKLQKANVPESASPGRNT